MSPRTRSASKRSLEAELSTGSTTVSNPVQHSYLDRHLLRELRIVQQKERELSQVAHDLTVLLYSGAKWNSDVLLDEQKHHIISSVNHQETITSCWI